VVTGAGIGIGLTTVQNFTDAGARVISTNREVVEATIDSELIVRQKDDRR
jgi:NAD(P)-dependent dehydrogenase (short-subunit alcohol dehydrogenase family)